MFVELLSTHLRLIYGRMWPTRVVQKNIPVRFNIFYSQISLSWAQRYPAISLSLSHAPFMYAKYFLRNGSPIKSDKKGTKAKRRTNQISKQSFKVAKRATISNLTLSSHQLYIIFISMHYVGFPQKVAIFVDLVERIPEIYFSK